MALHLNSVSSRTLTWSAAWGGLALMGAAGCFEDSSSQGDPPPTAGASSRFAAATPEEAAPRRPTLTLGEVGAPCASDAECAGDLCIPAGGERLCTRYCREACPEGWACTPLGTGPEADHVCMPGDAGGAKAAAQDDDGDGGSDTAEAQPDPTVGAPRADTPPPPAGCQSAALAGCLCGDLCGIATETVSVLVRTLDCKSQPVALVLPVGSDGCYGAESMPAGPATIELGLGTYAALHEVTVAPNALTDVNEQLGPEACLALPPETVTAPGCKTGGLAGCICGPSGGIAMEGVQVVVATQDGAGEPLTLSLETGPDGCYGAQGVPDGPAKIAFAVGTYAASYQVVVAPDAVTDVNAALGPDACLKLPADACEPTFQCVVRAGGTVASCLPGEFMVGGGCSTAMDGCYPGANSWVASGPMMGVGTAFAHCCTAAPGLDPSSGVVRGAAVAGSVVTASCEAGEIALAGGCYSTAGWHVSVVRSATSVTCSAPGFSNSLSATALCYKPLEGGPVLTEVTAPGVAVCPAGTQLLGGGWAGCASAWDAAYPSGQSFATSCGTAYALCGAGSPAPACGAAP